MINHLTQTLLVLSVLASAFSTVAQPVEKVPVDFGKCPRPEYPTPSRAKGVQGITTLIYELGEDGSVKSIMIEKSAGDTREHKMLDKVALDTARRCKITSMAEIDRPLSIRGRVSYRWSLSAPSASASTPAQPLDPEPKQPAPLIATLTAPAAVAPAASGTKSAAEPTAQSPRTFGPVDSPAVKRLRELEALRKEGLISETEYQDKRKAILSSL